MCGDAEASNFPISEYLSAARAGDAVAMAELLEYYRPYLKLLARLWYRRQFQAKFDDSDLVQETMVIVHRDVHAFRGVTEIEFAGWLRRIMATVSGKHVRHYSRLCRDAGIERQLEESLSKSSAMIGNALATEESSPSQKLIRREKAVMLSRALTLLQADYREALIMYKLEGLTMAEIAERMGRSPDSVQKLIARGLLNLRRRLEETA